MTDDELDALTASIVARQGAFIHGGDVLENGHCEPSRNGHCEPGRIDPPDGFNAVNYPAAEAKPRLSFHRLHGRDFWDAEYEQEFLIDGVLAAGQPGVIGALKKSLKTTLAIEQAISLAAGIPFLAKFNVPKPVRVGIMSGESGACTIQETFKRICRAKNWAPGEEGDNLRFCFSVPRLNDPLHLDALERFIVEDELQVLYIDPTYLALGGVADQAGNLFAVGNLLVGLTELGQRTGCTIQLVHHLRKNLAKPFDPPELEDLAWSAFAEWARQWLLIGRRVKYDPEQAGCHKLWFSVGGSAGHSSSWGLDVAEGKISDPGGRHWSAILATAAAARERDGEEAEGGRTERKEQSKTATVKVNREKVLQAFKRFPAGESARQIRESAGMSGETFGPILGQLRDEGLVVACEFARPGKTKPQHGFRLQAKTLYPDNEPGRWDGGTD